MRDKADGRRFLSGGKIEEFSDTYLEFRRETSCTGSVNVPGPLVEKNYEDSSSIGSRIIEKSEGFAKYSAARGRSERKFFRQIFVYFPDGRPKNKSLWVDKKNPVIENKINN